MKGVPVLMYHALEDAEHPAGAKEPGEQLYVLSANQFREQMEYLHKEGFRTFLLEELRSMDVWPEKAIVLTFDDGHESNYTLALLILREFGFRADFFITTDWIGDEHFLTREQIRALHDAGMGIGSHGASHAFISDLDEREIESELKEPRVTLNSIISRPVTSFSAPGGRLRKSDIILLYRNDYRIVCTSRPGMLKQDRPDKPIPRFSVRNSITQEEFIGIVNGDPSTIGRIERRDELLEVFKKLLGNRAYNYFRSLSLRVE